MASLDAYAALISALAVPPKKEDASDTFDLAGLHATAPFYANNFSGVFSPFSQPSTAQAPSSSRSASGSSASSSPLLHDLFSSGHRPDTKWSDIGGTDVLLTEPGTEMLGATSFPFASAFPFAPFAQPTASWGIDPGFTIAPSVLGPSNPSSAGSPASTSDDPFGQAAADMDAPAPRVPIGMDRLLVTDADENPISGPSPDEAGPSNPRPLHRAPEPDQAARPSDSGLEVAVSQKVLVVFWDERTGRPQPPAAHDPNGVHRKEGIKMVRFEPGEHYDVKQVADDTGAPVSVHPPAPWTGKGPGNAWLKGQLLVKAKCDCGFSFLGGTTAEDFFKRPSVLREHVRTCKEWPMSHPLKQLCSLNREAENKKPGKKAAAARKRPVAAAPAAGTSKKRSPPASSE